jgi:osmotically-inducible protein OsmY
MRADRLQNQIHSRLASSASLAGSDINATVNGNTVVLEGTVADERDKQRAARIATRVAGIEIVDNNLKIDQAASQRNKTVNVPDEQLSKQIAEKLVSTHFKNARVEQDWMFGWEVEGNDFEFEVDVDAGDVTLSGDVPRPGVIANVLKTARSVSGVRTVTSELRADRYYREYGPWPYSWGYHPYPFY